jgi:phenylalanyl-tRNA synthetase beta subunit
MKISYEWLQSFFDAPLPSPAELGERITFGAFEMEAIEAKGTDTLLDIKVLPDRAHDALSHRGIAHEVSVLLGISMKHDPLQNGTPQLMPLSNELSVSVEDAIAAPFYGAALIRGIEVKESPEWLRSRLETIGQRSINNIVDATNYVMFELGTPLHAFDARKLAAADGMKIVVRAAKDGETITALGGTEYALTPSISVIADGNSGAVLAIAGVKGGNVAEVGRETTDIILEGAAFESVRTRKASQALRLATDASKRFENGIAATLPLYGLAAAAKLIADIAGGTAAEFAHTPIPTEYPFVVGVSLSEVNARLGTTLQEEDVARVLALLGMEPVMIDPVEFVVAEAPSHIGVPYKRGASVLREAPNAFDCSSFIAWLYAHAGIALPRISIDQFAYGSAIEEGDLMPGDLIFANTHEVRSTAGEYYSQVLDEMVKEEAIRTKTLEFLPGTEIGHGVDHVGLYLGDYRVIHTSSSIGHVVIEDVRESLQFKNIVGYRRIAQKGASRFVVRVPFERLDIRQSADLIEEIGRIRGYDALPATPLPASPSAPLMNQNFYWSEMVRHALDALGFLEVMTYSLCDHGEEKLLNPLAADKGYLRGNLRDALAGAIEKNAYYAPLTGTEDVRIYEIGRIFRKGSEAIHVAVCAHAAAGKKQGDRTQALLLEAVAAIAAMLGTDQASLSLEADGDVIEFDLSRAMVGKQIEALSYPRCAAIKPGLLYAPISPYPFVLRDVALWVPAGLESAAVASVIREAASALLVRLDLFDSFEKDGRVSFAFHLLFQSMEHTLDDAEVGAIMEKVSEVITREGWEIR